MSLLARNTKINSIMRNAAYGTFGIPIYQPASLATAIATSQTPTVGVALTLDGTGVVNVSGSTTACYLPIPAPIVIESAATGDTWTAVVTGIDQFGDARSITITKSQTATRTQRYAGGAISWSRIDSIVLSATSGAAMTVGFRMAGQDSSANAETGQNSVFRIHAPTKLDATSELLGVYILDGGGGTFAAGAGQGAFLKSGVATFTVIYPTATTQGNLTGFSYVSGATTQPTRPMTFLPFYAPGFIGGKY